MKKRGIYTDDKTQEMDFRQTNMNGNENSSDPIVQGTMAIKMGRRASSERSTRVSSPVMVGQPFCWKTFSYKTVHHCREVTRHHRVIFQPSVFETIPETDQTQRMTSAPSSDALKQQRLSQPSANPSWATLPRHSAPLTEFSSW